MIYLVTGTPGAGKTLFSLDLVYNQGEFGKDRQIYIDGIETDLDHETIDPLRWFDAPDGAIIIIDEAQRIFPPRKIGAGVPEYVQRLETHRHQGIDIVLITQDAFLIDAHVRRLVGRYFRVSRPGNMRYGKVKTFEGVPTQQNKLVPIETKKWFHPKKLYERYKSTTLDTHKRRLPMKFFVFSFLLICILVGIPAAAWKIWDMFQDRKEAAERGEPFQAVTMEARAQGDYQATAQQLQSYADPYYSPDPARPWLAPAYEDARKAESAPTVFCIASRSKCMCQTEQSTRVFLDDLQCRRVARDGVYRPFIDAYTQDAGASGSAAPRPGSDQQNPVNAAVGL